MDKSNHLENSPQEEIGIGTLLRTEREKKGISKHSLAEIIKIRENNIDALENEEWDKLPARVFIKGFIRSYSLSIGYDTKKALSLFDKCFPPISEDSPKPLMQNTKKGRGIYYFFIILVILAGALYLFKVRESVDTPTKEVETVSNTSPSPIAELTPEVNLPEQVIPIEITSTDVTQEPAHAREDLQKSDEKYTPVSEILPDQNIKEEQTPVPEAATAATQSLMVLSATVNMRTWVKIISDDDPPKEYIFQPGSSHKWTATRGFYVTVGNAGGIEFDFNGKTIKDIGEVGMVKNLAFPDNFKTEQDE